MTKEIYMTNDKIKAKKALLAFAKANLKSKVMSISHINTRSEFIGLAAPACAIFKRSWLDAEPQVMDFTKKYPYDIIRNFYPEKMFDDTLQPGEFCYTGYISTTTSGLIIACKIPQE